ncbi:hypothetical protein WJX74_001820 [Apatococcus lobatus]|uniref:Uncharacterized protein n=1 Tax=Apatococcus lobatus TaxID=904363 RepID=A0AAW1S576_9CHLO
MNKKDSLSRCLKRAAGSPDKFQPTSAGAILALSLHCICVRSGLRTHPRQRGDPYQPPKNWDLAGNEWVFQMYIQLREEKPTGGNIHPLGLTVGRYISDAANLQQPQWEGLLTQQDALEQQLEEFCLEPLMREVNAISVQGPQGWLISCSSQLQDAYQTLQDRMPVPSVLIGLGSIAAVGVLLYWRSQKTHQPMFRQGFHPRHPLKLHR